jgi:hypothetical protein
MITDERLLLLYLKGFRDELRGKYQGYWELDDNLEIRAYNLGCDHAHIGDDVSSIDDIGDEEIVKTIRESGALQEEKTEPI